MNFRRPCWLLLYISIVAMVAGYSACMLAKPEKGGPALQWTIIKCGIVLMFIGAIGFGMALIWWLIAGIISSVRSRHPKH